MNRREFVHISASVAGLALLSSACDLAPVKSRVPRIGYLSPGPRESFVELVESFVDGLRALGYTDGKTIAIEWRFTSNGSDTQFRELAADLVRVPVDVIFAAGSTSAALAAQRATSTIPIVAVVARPVETGLVPNLVRPGGNVAALAVSVVEGTTTKKLDLLQSMVPGIARVAALVDPNNPYYDVVFWKDALTAGQRLGITVQRIDVRSGEDVAAAYEAATVSGADAVLGVQHPLLQPARTIVAALGLQYRLPGLFEARDYVAVGALMSHGANFPAVHRRAAVYIDRILKGAHPGDLPVEQPTAFDVTVNVNTAQALGLIIPPDVEAQVTEWVE